jgi:anti-sigma regulatory factor (Ser/Thr protein kinase)
MSQDEHSPAPLTLPTSSLAARLARRHIATIGGSWPADLRDLALLLTSELVTNALRYGNGGGIRLTVRQTQHALRVEVHDANPEAPELSPNLDGTAEHGRGLHIIDSLATRWGHTSSADPAGKTVWFELQHRQTGPDGHSG